MKPDVHATNHEVIRSTRIRSVCASLFLAAACSGTCPHAAPATTGTIDSIAAKAMIRFEAPSYKHGTICMMLCDAETSRVLFEHNADKAIMPASIMKAVTTAAAFHYLSPDARFSTTLETSGTRQNTVLMGDLLIRGGGDPTLGSPRVEGSHSSTTLVENWTSAVLQAGIRRIDGAVVADDSILTRDAVPNGWEWGDIGNGYGAFPVGLCFSDNVYGLYFRPGNSVGDPAPVIRTDPLLPELRWTNEMRTGAKGSGD